MYEKKIRLDYSVVDDTHRACSICCFGEFKNCGRNGGQKLKNKIEYIISTAISLILLEMGFFYALAWYWSGFEWSPFGYETCGMEFLVILLLTYPAFILGLLIRSGLLFRWKYPHYIWYLPLVLCGIASCAFAKSLEMGIFCIIAMLALPIVDFSGIKNAVRKMCNPQVENACEK